MNLQRTTKFLGLFTNQAPEGYIVPPAPPVVTPPAPQMVPATMVVDIAEALARRTAAQQQLQQVQNPPPPPPPVPPPAPEPTTSNDAILAEMKRLRKSNDDLAATLKYQQLETYRANAISQARANGQDLIDSLVFGNSPQEIDATLGVAVAEYHLLEQRFQQKYQPPPPPVVEVQQYPQATVTGTEVSLPGYIAANNPPPEQSGIDPESLRYATSSESIRDGTYAQNRNQIHAQLRRGMSRPPEQWALNPGYSLAPPMPPAIPQPIGSAPGRQQAMAPNAFAGVTMPQVRQATSPQAGPVPGVPFRGIPSQPVGGGTLQGDQQFAQAAQSPAQARAAAMRTVSPAAKAALETGRR